MEENKIIRRQGIMTTEVYDKLSADFIELFEGFEGVSVTVTEADDDSSVSASTIIYLDSGNRQFLKIIPDTIYGVKISFHCGDGETENTDWVYVDKRDRSDYATYSMLKTPYGVAFSTMPSATDSSFTLSDGYIANFFTTVEDENGVSKNAFFFAGNNKDETSNVNYYVSSEDHERFEILNITKSFLGSGANHTVLINATSYTKPLVAKHLYKKFQTEEGKFGKIKLNGKSFVAGSHFCLECGEE